MTLGAAEEKPAAARSEAALVVAMALSGITLFALSPVTSRVIAQELDPLMAGLVRTVGAIVLTLPLALMLRLPLPRSRHDWQFLLVSTAGGFIAFPVLFCLAGARTSASHLALIMATAPLFTGLIASAVERRPPRIAWWIGAAIAFAGEAVVVAARDPAGGRAATLAGDLLALGACLGSGASYVAGARLTATIGSWAATFWAVNIASLVQAPFVALLWSRTDWSGIGPAGWAALLHLTYGTTVIAFLPWLWALARGGIARVAVLQFAQPVIGLGLAALLLGERITLPLLAAAAGILAGIAIARRR